MAALDSDPFAAIAPKSQAANAADLDPFASIAPIKPPESSSSSSVPRSALATVGHEAALAGSNALLGLGQGLGAVQDLTHKALSYVPPGMIDDYKALSNSVYTGITGGKPDVSATGAITAELNKAGLTNVPSLAPSGPGENFLAAGSRGLGAAAPFALMGGPVTALGSGLAGGLASEGVKEAGAPGWAQTGAGILAGLGVGGVASVASNISRASQASEAVARAQSELTAAQAAVDAARVNNPLKLNAAKTDLDSARTAAANAIADAKSSSEAARDSVVNSAQNTIANSKSALDKTLALHDSAGAVSEAARDAQIAQGTAAASQASAGADKSIESVAAAHGTSATLQDAGEKLQNGARSWLTTTLPAKQASVWKPVDDAIPSSTPTDLSAFKASLGAINKSAGALEPVAQLLKPRLPVQLQTTLSNVLENPAGTPITWGNVQKLRSTLGDAMSDPKTVSDVGAQNLSRLYASLTSDMGRVADSAGATEAFQAANKESTRLYGVAEGPVAKIVSGPKASLADDPAPGKVAASLLTGARSGNTDLAALAGEGFPVGELSAAQLREDPAAWEKLSPEAQRTLVPDPVHRATLDASLATKSGESDTSKALAQQAKDAHVAELDRLAAASQAAKDSHAQTVSQAQAAIDAAKDAHKATVAQASANAKFGPATSAARVKDLSQTQQAETTSQALALRNAKANIAGMVSPSGPVSLGSHALHSLVGGNVGGELGMLLGHLVDASGLSPLEHGAAGALIGAGAPMAFRGAKNLLTNPSALRNPLVGGLAGSGQ
jgi:hypothetical protein